MNKRVQIELLTEQTVSVVVVKSVEVDGREYEIERVRKAYNNSATDREVLINDIGEPYTSAIFALWGDTATVADPPAPTTSEESEVDGTAEN